MEMYQQAGEIIWSVWNRPPFLCSVPAASEGNTTTVYC